MIHVWLHFFKPHENIAQFFKLHNAACLYGHFPKGRNVDILSLRILPHVRGWIDGKALFQDNLVKRTNIATFS